MFPSGGTHLSVENTIVWLVALDGRYIPCDIVLYWSGFRNRTRTNFLSWGHLKSAFVE